MTTTLRHRYAARLFTLLLLLMVGMQVVWAGVQFEAKKRITNNGDGTFTTAHNAGNDCALAIADLSEIAGIDASGAVVKVEFDCTISGDRWLIGLGDKDIRGENAYNSTHISYDKTGLMMWFGTSNGNDYKVNDGSANNSAFGVSVHATITFDKANNKYSYTLKNGETTLFSGTDISTTVSNLTVIELYSWANSITTSISDVKVFDGFYFSKGTDVMYIEDLVYNSPLVNETGESVTYTITGNNRNIRTESNNNFPFYPIRTTGDNPATLDNGDPIVVTATTGTTGKTSTLNLRVKTRKAITASSLVSGDAFNVGNSVGLITDEFVNINGLTMHFGANSGNNGENKDEQQVVRNINGGYAVTCIDANGWTFGNIVNFNQFGEYWGTFYRLATDANPKDLVITGYFSGDGGLYNESGTKVFDIPSSAGNLALVRITHDQLLANTAYYLYCPMGLAALRSLAYTNFDVNFRYGTKDEAVAFKNETLAAPTFTVTNASGEDVSSHYTMGGFSSSVAGVATVVSETGVVTTGSTQGKTVISCTLTSDDATKNTYPNIPIVFNLYVTDGEWDIENGVGWTSMDAADGPSNTQWSLRGSSHNRNKLYTNTDFEYIYNKNGDLFSPTYGLQIKGHSRFTANQYATGTGSITMFATDDNAALRIPARRGMLVEITGYASDEETELTFEGVKNIDGTEVKSFMSGMTSTSKKFLCDTDAGYVTLYNDNVALSVNIQKIIVSSEIVLRDGNEGGEIYVDKEQDYQNAILNADGSGSTFSYSWVGEHSIAMEAADFSTTGHISGFTGYGTATIRVNATGGLLNGKTKDFTIRPIKMSVIHSAPKALLTKVGISGTISDDTSLGSDYYNYRNDLKQNIRVYKDNDSDVDATLRGQVVFAYESCTKPATTATVTKSGDNYVFQADGLGNVTIKATLGTIERTFTYQIQGVEYATMNPVIGSDETSYDLVVSNMGGTVNSIGEVTIAATYGNLGTPTITKEGNTIKISGITEKDGWTNIDDNIPSTKGGTYTIAAVVNYTPDGGSSTDYTISTILTVAYGQNIWNFRGGDSGLAPYGISETMYDNEATPNSYTDRPLPKNQEDYEVARNTLWEYQKKFRSPDSQGGYVYAYRHIVNGNNAPIINETAGLLIYAQGTMGVSSDALWTQNGYARTGTDKGEYYEDANGKKYSKTDKKRDLIFKSGCRIVIPHVKPGQQIDLYWHRHSDDQGERLRMKNLCDASGEEITDIYKIAFTGMGHTDKQATGAGSYSFIVKDTGEEYVDVEISSVDGTWTCIHEIVLWEKPTSDYSDTQSTYRSTMDNMSADRYLHVDNDESFTIDMNDDVWSLNVHNGGTPTYTIKMDKTLNATVDMSSRHPIFHYNNGWGKFYVTLSNCTQDGKYISTWRNYTITVGKKPEQTYPHTWDFTKYMNNTKTNIASSDRVEENVVIQVREDKVKTVSRATQTWNVNSNDYAVITTHYGESSYESYHVDGAQLVSSALNAPLPETEGLGFNLNNGTAGLTLSMVNTTANSGEQAQKVGENYQTWKSSGKLSIGSGGKVIVPKPNDDTNYGNYYIYVNSSVEPSAYTNVVKMVSESAGANEVVDANYDVPTGVYKYRFMANANAEFTFGSDAEIYAIAVTDEFKQMTKLGTGWATESRDRAIDYTLNSLLTTNPMKAYAIIEKSGNPLYSDDKTKTTVAINDERYVVPANQGLVLKQVTGVPDIAEKATYQVPLFVPAVTTASDAAYQFENNLMRPCVEGKTFTAETENLDGTTGTDYTVFILTNRYMTWKKEGSNAATYDEHFTSGNVAAFYRMHLYGNDSYDGGTARNTLGVNKAYLLLRTDKINAPIWNTSSPAPAPQYIGIAGVSDMDEAVSQTEEQQDDGRTYNLRGQAVDGSKALPAGIYIRNGRKIIIR